MSNYRRRAIISVTNKVGVVPFGLALQNNGYKIYSTGGTAKELRLGGVNVTDIAELTGFPEGMDGRIKTLHPMVFGGVLGRLDLEGHVAFQTEHGIEPFQIVAVNLYDFLGTIADPTTLFDAAVEQIDIGGPSMIRAAAKNYRFSIPVVDPSDYDAVIRLIEDDLLDHNDEFRLDMQLKAFKMTATYDAAIAWYLRLQKLSRAKQG
jgi:phosphoribosylaminoimidazolecarboxamide formyltransferase/IMP cyclohydrolase